MSEGSKEAVALQLLQIIAAVQGKNLNLTTSDDPAAPGSRWVFKTYAKCLDLVENPQNYTSGKTGTSKAKKTTGTKPPISRKTGGSS